ncbi:hypothetical protein ACFYPB_44195, partial [Streptomyces olivaceoviridis]|uniref:hypothetical protein n=1 Tax=Streptomyces olivaceoviridis TaxID=1921 RepID=UPI0036A58F76
MGDAPAADDEGDGRRRGRAQAAGPLGTQQGQTQQAAERREQGERQRAMAELVEQAGGVRPQDE